ncbi:EAL domain-containing protein [Sulfurivirga caldicuralii]|uniref:EAL domain-containing protein n=1 Tax=Sulfurivirga caldicuralii TaxID=364032 RepID=UPI0009FF521C|nr:EAL domain-containing protein [Sulfurivirga caldicuralii]
MAEALGLDVVAEGVEGQEQKEILTRQGCMEHQGYFYGKPMPADAFARLLKQSA